MLYGTGKTIEWTPLWFLPHLFLSLIFARLLLKILNSMRSSTGYLLVAILLAIGVYFIDYFWQSKAIQLGSIKTYRLGLPWSLDLLPITSAFVIFGSLLSRQVKSMGFNPARFLMSLITFSCLHYFFNETMELNIRTYGNLLISTLQAIMGIYICLSLSSLLQKYASCQKPLAYIGSGSLCILIFHAYIQFEVFSALSKLIANPYLNGVVSLIIGIVTSLAIWEVAKRHRVLAGMLLPLRQNPFQQANRFWCCGEYRMAVMCRSCAS